MLRRAPSRGTIISVVLTAAVLVLATVEALGPGNRWPAPLSVNLVALPLMAVPLAFLHRRALPAALTIIATETAYSAWFGTPESIAGLVVFGWIAFVSGAHTGPHARWLYAALAVLVISVTVFSRNTTGLEDFMFSIFYAGLAFVAGRVVRSRQQLAERLEAQQEVIAAAAVSNERSRIARELHDVVAHAVSVIVVQAAAGRSMLRRDPNRVDAALASIEETGKDAMAELRRLLGVLRSVEGEGMILTPQPGLKDLDGLLARARESGLAVDLEVRGDDRPLPPGVDLAVFRVIQEALTNAIRHARCRRATVRLTWGPGALEVEVVDDGRGAAPAAGKRDPGDTGHGLVGMRERVALYAGDLTVGPHDDGGFAVRARLPIGA